MENFKIEDDVIRMREGDSPGSIISNRMDMEKTREGGDRSMLLIREEMTEF